jgi:hypothetical protein
MKWVTAIRFQAWIVNLLFLTMAARSVGPTQTLYLFGFFLNVPEHEAHTRLLNRPRVGKFIPVTGCESP